MEFKTVHEGKKLTYIMPVKLDPNSLIEFEDDVNKRINDIEELELDLTDLDFISSSTIRVFIDLHLKLEKNFTISHPNEEVMEIFEMTGLDKTMNIIK